MKVAVLFGGEVALTTFVQVQICVAMIKYVVKSAVDFFFASRGINYQVETETREQKLEEAKKILYGERPHSEVRTFTSTDGSGRVLLRR